MTHWQGWGGGSGGEGAGGDSGGGGEARECGREGGEGEDGGEDSGEGREGEGSALVIAAHASSRDMRLPRGGRAQIGFEGHVDAGFFQAAELPQSVHEASRLSQGSTNTRAVDERLLVCTASSQNQRVTRALHCNRQEGTAGPDRDNNTRGRIYYSFFF